MKRIVVALAALVLGMAASPALAQQADPSAMPGDHTQNSVPPAPPPPRYNPPPFPPMPKLRPGYHKSQATTHHRSTAKAKHRATRPERHSTSSKHHATKSRKHESVRHHRAETVKAAKVHLSKRTIRQCHGMNYRAIMKNSHCRALMTQELAASEKHHVSKHHHSSKKAKTKVKVHRSHRHRR